MKILLFAFTALLLISSCKDKDKEGPKKVTSIAITPLSPNVAVGGIQQLSADITPADAVQKEVIWVSSDQKIATVDATGLVTGLAKGTTTITAVAIDGSNVKGTVTINITATYAASVIVNPPNPSVGINEKLTLTAAVTPVDANQTVTWTSSNPDKATIDSSTGAVTGIALGSTTITAAVADGSNVKGTITLNVIAKATSITIMPVSPSVSIGQKITLTVTVAPNEAAKTVTWTSSNPDKATIDASAGVVTGVALGNTTITATAADGSGVIQTATLTVTSTDTVIALGDENFIIAVPANGATTLANAPRTIASSLTAVKVNITAGANASIKIGNGDFTQGQIVDFTNLVTFTVTAQNGTVKSYTVGITPYDRVANPYGIYTVKHLADLANYRLMPTDASFLLKNNIAMPGKDAADAATVTGISDYASAGWLPLDSFNGFHGTFDGGNFSINNFYINRVAEEVGLFNQLGEGGTIKNLGVNGVSGVAVMGREGAGSEQFTGILAGCSSGTIDKCYATGNVFSSSSVYIGGLVGRNSGSISHSYATGNVSSSSATSVFIGGLVGRNQKEGSISHSYATGNVSSSAASGGLAGWNEEGSISHSYATGNVSSSNSSYASSGGLVGANVRGRYTNCYRNNDAAIKMNNQAVAPDDASVTGITTKTRAEMQTDAFKENLNGTSGTTWGRSDAKNDRLPYIIGVGIGR